MFLWLFLIIFCVCWSFLTPRSQYGSNAVPFKKRQILLVWMWLAGGGSEGGRMDWGRQWQNPVMIWLFCAAEHRGEREREGLWMRQDVDMFLNLMCFCLLPGWSWAHTASTELYRGWSSVTARRDWVSFFLLWPLWPLNHCHCLTFL